MSRRYPVPSDIWTYLLDNSEHMEESEESWKEYYLNRAERLWNEANSLPEQMSSWRRRCLRYHLLRISWSCLMNAEVGLKERKRMDAWRGKEIRKALSKAKPVLL